MKPLLLLVFLFFVGHVTAQEYLKLGDACYNNKDYKCAYDNYIKARETGMNANKRVLFFRIGYCLGTMGRYEDAIKWHHLSLAETLEDKDAAYTTWELAACLYNIKKYDSATQYYTRAYSMIGNKESRYKIAYWNTNALYNLRRYKKAREWVDTCLKLEPAKAEVYSMSGLIAAEEYNIPLAESAFQEVLKISKDSALLEEALLELGELKYNKKLYSEAISYYRAAKNYAPVATNPWAFIADSYRLLNAVDSSEYYYKLVINGQQARPKVDSIYIARVAGIMITKRLQMKDTLKALPTIPILLRYNPYHSDAKSYLNILFTQKDIKTLETILPVYLATRYPRGGILSSPIVEAMYYNQLGNLYRDSKQNQQAIKTYNVAFTINRNNVDPFVSILRMMMADKKFKEAADSIELKLSQVQPLYRTPILLVKAELATLKKDTVAAAAVYRDIIKHTPTYSSANYPSHFYLGMMALQRKDSTQCWLYWDRIASQSFSQSKELAYPVLVFAGMRRYKTASTAYAFEETARYLDKAVALDSSIPAVRLYAAMANINSAKYPTAKKHLNGLLVPYAKVKDTLAMVYRSLGYIEMKSVSNPDFASAIKYYKEAQKAAPQDSTISSDIGTIYYEQKDYTQAAEAFAVQATLVKDKGNKATAYYNQALCYYMNKQNAHAKAQAAKCLELVPEHVDAKKLMAAIEKPAG